MNYQVTHLVEYDLEVLPGCFMFGVKMWDGKYIQYVNPDPDMIRRFIEYIERQGYELASFNGGGYDDYVLSEYLVNGDPMDAYNTSVGIIEHGNKPWNYRRDVWSVDLMQVLPGRKGLKVLGVILGHDKLQEMPIDYHAVPSEAEIESEAAYNRNDLDITEKLKHKLQKELDLRSAMSQRYDIDLRSKGEAAMAEAVLLTESGFVKKNMRNLATANLAAHPIFRIDPPSWWDGFCTLGSASKNIRKVIKAGEDLFHRDIRVINDRIPNDAMADTVFIGDRYYTMGVGGLHSVDGAGCWVPGKNEQMVDIDVASYYPNIILTQELQPEFWEGEFLPIYRKIVEERLAAKKSGDKTTADVLKIVANGSFGKFGDKYSALYDQRLLAHVTIYGQLGLLALIAMLEDFGHRVVSANTDGVTVISTNPSDEKDIVTSWERMTNLTMEYTPYRGLYQMDVNNYIAITTDGKAKTKGRFIAKPDLRHMPNALIVARAIGEYLKYNTPLAETIMGCTGIHMFIIAAQVKGAWKIYHGDEPLGKIARFYKSITPHLPQIRKVPTADDVKGNAGQLPGSADCVPLPDLPKVIPADLDYQWYIDKAAELLDQISIPKVPRMNAYAEDLVKLGFQPNVVARGERLSRANVEYGSVDYCSIPAGHELVVRTGEAAGLLAVLVNGVLKTMYSVPDRYPPKTRDTIERDKGFRLIYGGSVPIPAWDIPIHPAVPGLFDQHYTASELKKVRG